MCIVLYCTVVFCFVLYALYCIIVLYYSYNHRLNSELRNVLASEGNDTELGLSADS